MTRLVTIMKKKLFTLISAVAVLSLTSCQIVDFFNHGERTSSNTPITNSETTQSSEESISSIDDVQSSTSTSISSTSESQTSTSTAPSTSSYSGGSSTHSSSAASSSMSSSSKSSSSSSSSSSAQPVTNPISSYKAKYDYMDFMEHNVYPLSSTPCVGSAHLLVIPVWFNDSSSFIASSKKEHIRDEIRKAYFGTNEETGWRSVKTFYEEESHGALSLSGTVSSWYEVSNSYTYYGSENSSGTKTSSLVKNATNWYFTNNPSDSRKNYDKDGDGYLDGVMLIYGAPDYSALNKSNYDNLWAYCYWLQETTQKNVNKPGPNVFFWASYDFMYSRGDAYFHTNVASSIYGSGDTQHCSVDAHTYIHEMGHMFGLEDYYDYSNNGYDPAGGFSMQDHNVGGHDPFSAFALGWGEAYAPTSTMTINLKPFTSSGEMILLSNATTSGSRSPFDEYLLLEFYTPTGLNKFDTDYLYCGSGPQGASASGIRLWHVDARLAWYTNVNPNAAPSITNDPTKSGGTVTMGMSNTYSDGTQYTEGYLSPLGSSYYNYNVLQMIRNNTTLNYKPTTGKGLSNEHLFRTGETFTMSKYSKQFVNSGKLNTNQALNFSFTVNNISSEYASITVTKI